jgi:hypothetical protein
MIEQDLAELRQADPQSGVGFDFLHRQFDPSWLRSPESRFELVGVVNRSDRAGGGACGDIRVVYRFAYTAKATEGRLPMTLSLVFPQPDDGDGCAKTASGWLAARAGTADALLDGPLKDHAPLAWIDVNLQAVRWPSNARRDLGGEADYILRTFWVRGDDVGPEALENTPRPDLSDADKEELRGFIRDNLAAIDQGSAVLPKKFLATRAISAGPSGLARLANRPFSQLFPDAKAAFGDLPFDQTKQIGSLAALMRRLDTSTCQGCHDARAVAGFHLLGEERDPAARMNALTFGTSPHLNDDLAWRRKRLVATAAKQPLEVPRPFSEHGGTAGGIGAHCGLGDPGFRSWTCAEGLECVDVHGDVVGSCSPPKSPVGDICQIAKIPLVADPHQDIVAGRLSFSCDASGPNARCDTVANGFPEGMCRTDCAAADSGKIAGDTICGGIPTASGLTKCLTVDRLPFAQCLATQNNPSLLKSCDVAHPCRDDYACVRIANGPSDVGACMPPYFAFQVRVDGHMFDE